MTNKDTEVRPDWVGCCPQTTAAIYHLRDGPGTGSQIKELVMGRIGSKLRTKM